MRFPGVGALGHTEHALRPDTRGTDTGTAGPPEEES